MTGYLRRLALSPREETASIRPLRGSVFAPRAPFTNEGFDIEQEEMAASVAEQRRFDADAPQPAQPAPFQPYNPSRLAPPPKAAIEARAPSMETLSTDPAEKPAERLAREKDRASAGAVRAPTQKQQVELRGRPRAGDGEAGLTHRLVSAIRSSPEVGGAPPSEAAHRVAPDAHARLLETGFVAPTTRRERAAFVAPRREAPPDEVHIHIGRIEVTAIQPPRPAPRPQQNATFLEDYVKRRDGRAR
jgi:hypothetical protein